MTASDPTLVHHLRRSVGFAALGAVLAYTFADASPEFFTIMLCGLASAWWIAVLPQRPAPTRAINAGLLGVLGTGVFQMLRMGFTVSAFAYFIGLLLIVKLFDLRRARDWGQALVLITGLYISAVLTSNSIITGLMLLIGSVLLFRAVLRHQIHAAAERGGRAAAAPTPSQRRDLRSLQLGAGFAIVAVAAVIFIFLPRNLGADSFGNWGVMPTGQTTGFTDEVQLGGPGLISQSQTPVMDITVLDRNERNRGRADSAPIYLRGAVLETYEDGRWRRDRGPGARSLIRAQYIPDGAAIRPWLSPRTDIWETEVRVILRAAAAGVTPLFTLWQPLELRPTGAGQFLAHDAATGMVLREGSPGRLEYTVRALDPRFSRIDYPSPSDAARPGFDPGIVPPRVREYALGVLGVAEIEPDPALRPIEDDIRAVRVLENHLKSAFSYTLVDEPVPPGREPTEWFLYDRREGHCEYYASALALMVRAIGVNARVVTGYVASEYNDVTSQYIVRESNAHGWVEAEVAPGYWMTFDGTPPLQLNQIHQPPPSLWRSVKKVYETIEFAWGAGIVGFNTDTQRALLGDLATDFGLRAFGGRMIERLRHDARGLVVRAAAAAGAVFACSMMIGLVILRRRDILARVAAIITDRLRRLLGLLTAPRTDGPDRLHRRTLHALARAGRAKPHDRPLRAHLTDSAPHLAPPLAAALTEACDLLYRVRYSPRPGATEPDIRRLIRDIRRSEKAQPPASVR